MVQNGTANSLLFIHPGLCFICFPIHYRIQTFTNCTQMIKRLDNGAPWFQLIMNCTKDSRGPTFLSTKKCQEGRQQQQQQQQQQKPFQTAILKSHKTLISHQHKPSDLSSWAPAPQKQEVGDNKPSVPGAGLWYAALSQQFALPPRTEQTSPFLCE